MNPEFQLVFSSLWINWFLVLNISVPAWMFSLRGVINTFCVWLSLPAKRELFKTWKWGRKLGCMLKDYLISQENVPVFDLAIYYLIIAQILLSYILIYIFYLVGKITPQVIILLACRTSTGFFCNLAILSYPSFLFWKCWWIT